MNVEEAIAVAMGRGNSFITSPDYMKTGDVFDEIALSCSFPETVPVTWVQLFDSWLKGHIWDAIFLDFVAWHTPALFEITKCLIGAYAGGSI